jgi:hypothetical protein
LRHLATNNDMGDTDAQRSAYLAAGRRGDKQSDAIWEGGIYVSFSGVAGRLIISMSALRTLCKATRLRILANGMDMLLYALALHRHLGSTHLHLPGDLVFPDYIKLFKLGKLKKE